MSFLGLPNFTQPITKNSSIDRTWYTFIQGMWKGQAPGTEAPVTLTPSPFIYTASRKGFAIVQGGTVSVVSWQGSARGSTTPHNTGQTSGCFPLSQGDQLIITYSSAPNVTFVPQ